MNQQPNPEQPRLFNPLREDCIIVQSSATINAPSSVISTGTMKVVDVTETSTGFVLNVSTRPEIVANMGSVASPTNRPMVATRHFRTGGWTISPQGGIRWAYLSDPDLVRSDGSSDASVFTTAGSGAPGPAAPVFSVMRNDLRNMGLNYHLIANYKDPMFTVAETADYLVAGSWDCSKDLSASGSSNWDDGSTTITTSANSSNPHTHTVTALRAHGSQVQAKYYLYKRTSSTATSSEWVLATELVESKINGFDSGSNVYNHMGTVQVVRLDAGNQLRLQFSAASFVGGSGPYTLQVDDAGFYIENLGLGSTGVNPNTIAVSP